jgi:thiol-disulfide isomerase/thioredoxin
MLPPDQLQAHLNGALPYDAYLATATSEQASKWNDSFARVRLLPAQRSIVSAFTRRVNMLVVSGVWCGDCAHQCPILEHLARVKPADHRDCNAPGINLRFADRDRHIDLSNAVKICGGNRVPTVIFTNEDHDFVGIMGDKSLARLRAVAARKLGASCPLPGAPVPDDELAATTQDWLNEIERVHLLVRLSTKLRARHAD